MTEHIFDRAKREAASMVYVPAARYFDEHVLMHRSHKAGLLFRCDCGRHYYSARYRELRCVRGLCEGAR